LLRAAGQVMPSGVSLSHYSSPRRGGCPSSAYRDHKAMGVSDSLAILHL
jgi:hypothetical protein